MKHTITIRLTKQGQKAAILAGLSGEQKQTIEVPLALLPKLLTLPDVGIASDGSASLNAYNAYYGCVYQDLDALPSGADEAIAVSTAAVETAAAEAQAAAQAEAERQQAASAAYVASTLANRVRQNYGVWEAQKSYPGAAGYEKALAEAEAEAARLNAIERERQALEREERDRKEREDREDRERWIAAYGSERLRLAMEAKLLDTVETSYVEERLTQERPGWRIELAAERRGSVREPSEPALAALVSARKRWPSCELVWLRRHNEGGCEALADDALGFEVVCEVEGGRDDRNREDGD